jgi:hypothetical protein
LNYKKQLKNQEYPNMPLKVCFTKDGVYSRAQYCLKKYYAIDEHDMGASFSEITGKLTVIGTFFFSPSIIVA